MLSITLDGLISGVSLYKSRIVNNIYFDNLSYDAFKANLFGSSSRLKIRYRWYGNLTDNQNGDFSFCWL